jgi:hypothetical protein
MATKDTALAGDLLGFELAVEGFEDPVLEDFAMAGFYFTEDEAEARGAMVEDDGFGFEGFAIVVNLEQDVALQFEQGGGFEETALEAEFGDAAGGDGFRRGLRSDFGMGVKGKAQTTAFSAHLERIF